MNLPLDDMIKCITMLDRLDLFSLRALNIVPNHKPIRLDANMRISSKLRVSCRVIWQNHPNFIESFIASQALTHEDKEILMAWKYCKVSE